ncbi:DUF5719 family protein [Streptomyces sp. MJP52]|uniref:DUF5719 family protein n=1 Tax=Streptomyces sp. MJP52 TaxID=2940555 RepID=UPI002473D7C8|nr:DUF5719 family protein [Streptomyces sp. MJP52]MDH6226632.1 hypothetical protein [Streptomyces sp. MJP52]
MNRTISLIAGTVALAAVTGVAVLTAPEPQSAVTAGATAAEQPVERTKLLCPSPSRSDVAETVYTAFTPVTEDAADGGEAGLLPAAPPSGGDGAEDPAEKDEDAGAEETEETGSAEDAGGSEESGGAGGADGSDAAARPAGKPVLTLEKPGEPVSRERSGGDEPALLGTADGRFAPGWTVQQTTTVTVGAGRGLHGTTCSAPDTDFWFPGASTAEFRTDYVHLTNPDDSAAVVDIELFGPEGQLETSVPDGVTVPPLGSERVLLSTLTDQPLPDVTAHVSVRSGRVGARVQALDTGNGGDWIAPAADPAGSLVLPGIPKDATSVRLIAYAPGDSDADLDVRLASPTGVITPAGLETLHVKAGMTTSTDLKDVTRGEAGSLLLTPTGREVPVVAGLQVVRGKGGKQETAFIPATAAVTTRATALGNTAKGTTLSLVAPTEDATVKVTSSAGSGGGTGTSKTYELKKGTTTDIELPVPNGLEGTYALVVEPVSGGPVYASRTLSEKLDGIAAFTVQTLPDDRGRVAVPEAEQDLTVLQD